jgi:hypothetical protein
MMHLGEYLRRAATSPAPGAIPCGFFSADWAVACGAADPLAFMRDDSEVKTAARFARYGTLELARLGAVMAGLAEPDEPRTGDVGVIIRPTDDGGHHACAIYSDGKWASLGVSGLEVGPAVALAVWRP